MKTPFLSEEVWDTLQGYLQLVSLACGAELFACGVPADSVYFLQSGRLGVQAEIGFEGRTQVIALLDPGAIIGEGAFAFSRTRTVAVRALEESTLFRLPASSFRQIEEREPALVVPLYKALLATSVLRLQAASARLATVL